MAHSLTKVSTFFSFLLLLIVFLSQCTTTFGVAGATSIYAAGVESLKFSPPEFVGSLRTAVAVLQDVTSKLTFSSKRFGNFHSSNANANAISDCQELLDMSSDVLQWSMSAIENPQGKNNGTGNLSSDLRTWLSAALSNTDTCMDGLEGTSSNVKDQISTGINKVNSIVQNLLSKVDPVLGYMSTKQDQFPSWVKLSDQKLLQTRNMHVDVVVATDGSGNYTRIMDAVNAAPEYSMRRFVILVKRGIYIENVDINKKKWNIVMIGEGMDSSIVSFNLSKTPNLSTYRTASFAVNGRGFIARDISFVNTAGPERNQSVALRSDSDLSVFYRCGIFGYQDSLYARILRQFYRECKITGTVDFIFGNATAVFQKCNILVKKGSPPQKNTITAQGATYPEQYSCFTIQFCNISADYDLLPYVNSTQTYLGRPWKAYSKTIFMQNYLSDIVNPKGWLEWNGTNYLDTLYYAEYQNFGPGAALDNRVKWPGYHVLNDADQATKFTVAQLLLGDLWLPSTGVDFISGLGA